MTDDPYRKNATPRQETVVDKVMRRINEFKYYEKCLHFDSTFLFLTITDNEEIRIYPQWIIDPIIKVFTRKDTNCHWEPTEVIYKNESKQKRKQFKKLVKQRIADIKESNKRKAQAERDDRYFTVIEKL